MRLLVNRDVHEPNRRIAQAESSAQEESSLQYNDPTECKSILACTGIDNLSRLNLLPPTVSRALPNGRVARAFGIENAFTAMNEDDRKAFKIQATNKLIGDDENRWKDIARLAGHILRKKIQVFGEGPTRIHLVTLIQLLSLKISLHVLFQQDPLALDDEAVTSLAWTINALWILSKEPCPNKELMTFHQEKLSEDLSYLLPYLSPTCPGDTPMNFIIPAYETLWRVVIRSFIEVVFRHPLSAAAWRSVLAEYMANPTTAQFSQRLPGPPREVASISAEDLAKEALRLYPPTRRIYRTFRYETGPELVTVAANIEDVHRNPALWVRDSTKYDPGRWAHETQDVSAKYFPFGGKRMMCPAQRIFGPRMIAMLLAVLANEFEAGSWKLEADEAGKAEMQKWKDEPGKPLDSSRKAHTSLYLCSNRYS